MSRALKSSVCGVCSDLLEEDEVGKMSVCREREIVLKGTVKVSLWCWINRGGWCLPSPAIVSMLSLSHFNIEKIICQWVIHNSHRSVYVTS